MSGHSDPQEYQWRATWFPDDVPERSVVGSEAKVRKTADANAAFLPIIERRPLGDWETVENYYAGRS